MRPEYYDNASIETINKEEQFYHSNPKHVKKRVKTFDTKKFIPSSLKVSPKFIEIYFK